MELVKNEKVVNLDNLIYVSKTILDCYGEILGGFVKNILDILEVFFNLLCILYYF